MDKLLLHACCAPCSSAVIVEEGFRGQTEDKKVVCALVQYLTGVSIDTDDWALHHEDKDHSNYSITNLSLVRKSSEHGSSAHTNLHLNNKISSSDIIILADIL